MDDLGGLPYEVDATSIQEVIKDEGLIDSTTKAEAGPKSKKSGSDEASPKMAE